MSRLAAARRASASTGERELSRSPSTASRWAASTGDTIGSALFAAGRRTFSRSFKYHRRARAACAAAGQCPNCLVQVDGAPGRARLHGAVARGHARSSTMNASPSLEFDVMRADRPVRRPVHAARLLLQDLHPPAAAVAALREGAARRRRTRPAAQATSTSASGARSTGAATPTCSSSAAASAGLARRDRARPSWAPTSCSPTRAPSRAAGCSPRAATSARASSPRGPREAGVELLSAAPALGFFDGLVPVWQGDTLHQVRAARASSTRPARSSSRSCSPATTCRA